MYCPTCGAEERQLSQYCRTCGTDLRSVRNTLERHDPVTTSAMSARDRISRAIAEKIREAQSATELHKVAEDVLPEIEKFLESPAEKRLRRIRSGVITTCIGLGASLGALLASLHDENLIILLIPGIVSFFIGIAMIVNGLVFSVPRKQLPGQVNTDAFPESLHRAGLLETSAFSETSQTSVASPRSVSVTEHTTKHLGNS